MPSPDLTGLIAALQRMFGEHRGWRPAHAKGIVCAGTFAGHPDARDRVRDRRGLAVRYAPPAVEIGQTSPPPASYATIAYHAVHAFGLTDARGTTRWARWHRLTEAGYEPLAVARARERSRDYLREDLAQRLAAGPVRYELDIELARDDDPLDDATALWEGEREHVRAGTLTLTRVAQELDAGDALLAFDPTNVADGIELSADPILLARRGAYPMSGAQRLRVRPG